MARNPTARISSASLHPNALMNPCVIGEKITWPSDPAAIPRPITRGRRFGSTIRAMVAMTSENDVKAFVPPTSSPATSRKTRGDSTIVMSHRPSA